MSRTLSFSSFWKLFSYSFLVLFFFHASISLPTYMVHLSCAFKGRGGGRGKSAGVFARLPRLARYHTSRRLFSGFLLHCLGQNRQFQRMCVRVKSTKGDNRELYTEIPHSQGLQYPTSHPVACTFTQRLCYLYGFYIFFFCFFFFCGSLHCLCFTYAYTKSLYVSISFTS